MTSVLFTVYSADATMGDLENALITIFGAHRLESALCRVRVFPRNSGCTYLGSAAECEAIRQELISRGFQARTWEGQ